MPVSRMWALRVTRSTNRDQAWVWEHCSPGQHVKTLGVHVGKQGWEPPAAVEPDQDPPVVADGVVFLHRYLRLLRVEVRTLPGTTLAGV